MQWNSAFFILLSSCHLSSTKTTRTFDLDTLSTYSHRRSDCLLHGSTIRDSCTQLLGDRLTYQYCVQLRSFDLEDVDLQVFSCDLFQLFFDLIYFCSPFTDYYTWTGSMNRKGDSFQRTLNDNF